MEIQEPNSQAIFRMLPLLRFCDYTGIVISDHSPVCMKLNFTDNIPSRRVWRLNPSLLADKEFKSFISKQIDFFLETNQTPDISKHTLWGAMKAFLQGQIISYNANVNKKRVERTNQLISRINAVDQEHSQNPHTNLYMERVALQTELDTLTTRSEEELYLKSRQREYEYGERDSKLLSHQLRQAIEAGYIAEMETSHGIATNQLDKNNQFKKFYVDLYMSESCGGAETETFLNNLELPPISEKHKENLDQPISAREIELAIIGMKSGKAPGHDGFPIDFYKKMCT